MSLCAYVYMCFVVTCWERADLLALVCVVYYEFVTFLLVSWVRCGTWLYWFLIFAPLLTLIIPWRHHLCIYKSLIREKLSKFSKLSFCQKINFLNQTQSCICSMCQHCIGKVLNCSMKSCGRSWSAHQSTIYVYTNTLLGKKCLSSHSCHFVKNYFFWTKLLHACSMCLHCIGKVSNCSIKSCGRSWSARVWPIIA